MASQLELSRKAHRLAFEAIVTWLRRSPALARVIKQWRVGEGRDDDATPWATDGGPGLKVTPAAGEAQAIAGGGPTVYSRPLVLRLEAFVPDLGVAGALDLADVVSARLCPSDDATYDALSDLLDGVEAMEIEELEPLAIDGEPGPSGVLLKGRYQIEMWF